MKPKNDRKNDEKLWNNEENKLEKMNKSHGKMKSMLETLVSPSHECLLLFMVFVLTVMYLHFVQGFC